ncbi:hypothetical protein WN51_08999 [Melipona quadrifasciata]|uniref:Uncharacterized protein n=1 Tax=Melipona quadrifasciata TaxID=166423 RepID=A0A0M9A9P6_9HYME|nr:hypothetical protein WN51_08999 [Melipona quadrifasciata]
MLYHQTDVEIPSISFLTSGPLATVSPKDLGHMAAFSSKQETNKALDRGLMHGTNFPEHVRSTGQRDDSGRQGPIRFDFLLSCQERISGESPKGWEVYVCIWMLVYYFAQADDTIDADKYCNQLDELKAASSRKTARIGERRWKKVIEQNGSYIT